MISRLATLGLAVTATLASPTPAVASCAPCITSESVAASLNTMLVQEGFAAIRSGYPVIRNVDLDGNPATEEALVDVFAPELCGPALICPTLVVAAREGRVFAIGSGRALVPLQSRTRGWRDLGASEPSLIPLLPTVTRAVRWRGLRYD